MQPSPERIQALYLALLLLSTLAASFIWGINTLFLLDAGLSNTEAFLANAFFTLGQVVFEIPTGIVADVFGRRVSYLIGTLTLAISTLLYLGAWAISAPLLLWATSSILLGLGFTFFSGSTEAWLVDALHSSGFKKPLESVFAKGHIVGGVAMLSGAVGGGWMAQMTNLSVPYLVRAVLLFVTFVVAFVYMKDWGFQPKGSKDWLQDVRHMFRSSVTYGWQQPSVRWLLFAAPFTAGVSFYAFYAMQPFLLELYQDETAYLVAGLAAAIVAGAQIAGGLAVPYIRRFFKLRTSVLLLAVAMSSLVLVFVGLTSQFWLAIALLCIWGLLSSAMVPVKQAYLNGLIPSSQRATVLSVEALMGSSGGVVIQPVLGRVADVWSYSASLLGAGAIQAVALPFILRARREKPQSDIISL